MMAPCASLVDDTAARSRIHLKRLKSFEAFETYETIRNQGGGNREYARVVHLSPIRALPASKTVCATPKHKTQVFRGVDGKHATVQRAGRCTLREQEPPGQY